MAEDATDERGATQREALRRRLRAKIRVGREGAAPRARQEARADLAGALLRMGVDDASLLLQAAQMLRARPPRVRDASGGDALDGPDEGLPPPDC